MIQSNANLGEGTQGSWTKQSCIKHADLSNVNVPHIKLLPGQDVQSICAESVFDKIVIKPAAMLRFCIDNIKRDTELGPHVSGTALPRQLPRHCNNCMAAPQ